MMQKRFFAVPALAALAGFTIGLTATFQRGDRERHSPGSESSGVAQGALGSSAPASMVSTPPDLQPRVASLLSAARSAGAGSAAAVELQRMVDRWLLAEPIACMMWLHDRGASGLVPRALFKDAFASAFQGDLTRAVQAGAEIGDPVLRSAWLRAAFAVAQETEPAHALKLVTALTLPMQMEIAQEVISAWAGQDGPAAWAAVVGGQRPYDAALADEGLQAWAKADPVAVEHFVRHKLADPTRGKERSLFRSALRALARKDASQIVLRSLAGAARDMHSQEIWMDAVRTSATGDLDAALQTIEREPRGLLRDAALGEFAKGAVQTNIDRSLEIAEVLPSYESRRAVFASVTKHLIADASRPEQAATLAQSHADPLLRVNQMDLVTAEWLQKDRIAFLQYVLSRPDPERAQWLDGLPRMVGFVSKPRASRRPAISEAQRVHLHRELTVRLPPDRLAKTMDNLLGG